MLIDIRRENKIQRQTDRYWEEREKEILRNCLGQKWRLASLWLQCGTQESWRCRWSVKVFCQRTPSCWERFIFLFYSSLQLIGEAHTHYGQQSAYPQVHQFNCSSHPKMPSKLTRKMNHFRNTDPREDDSIVQGYVAKPMKELRFSGLPVSMTTTPHHLPVRPWEASSTPKGRCEERAKASCLSSTMPTWQECKKPQFFCVSSLVHWRFNEKFFNTNFGFYLFFL